MSWKIQFPFGTRPYFQVHFGVSFGECIFVEGDIGKHQTTPKHPAVPKFNGWEPEQMMGKPPSSESPIPSFWCHLSG